MNFSKLSDYLEKLPEEWGIPQCAFVLRQGRETIFEKLVNADKDNVYWLYSATKLFTATMFCRLLEQGKLKLEDPVSDYLPEYAQLVIADEAGMDLVRQAIEEQLNAYFPAENADPAAISALLSDLNSAPFTLNTAFLQLHYRADSLYPNKTTLMHVRIPYTDLREHMTAEALRQTDNSNRRLLALTYDDGPVVGRTMRVVRNLRAGGATATFFLVGDRIHYCPNEVTLVHDTGFAVASHNYYHVYGSKNRGKVIEYRDKLNGELYKWIGTPVRLMRAPGGHEQVFINENVGLPIFHWSVISKSKDNKVTDPAAEARRLANNAKDGDIILLHDIYVGTDKMALTLPGLLADKGFLCVTIEELFAVKGMELLPNTVYWDARSDEETLDPARK